MNCLSVHLHYSEPWEYFLKDIVHPFCKDIIFTNHAEKYFFIRYWDKGPHIRLRFLGTSEYLAESLKLKVEEYFGSYFNNFPSKYSLAAVNALDQNILEEWMPNNTMIFVDYEPEVDRYGGPYGISICEDHFYLSSKTVIASYGSEKSIDYEQTIGLAIQLHLAFVFSFGLTTELSKNYFNRYFQEWSYDFKYFTIKGVDVVPEDSSARELLFLEKIGESIHIYTALIHKMWDALNQGLKYKEDWMNEWIIENRIIYNRLLNVYREGKLLTNNNSAFYESSYQVLSSLSHMTNNRLGLLNIDESLVAFIVYYAFSLY